MKPNEHLLKWININFSSRGTVVLFFDSESAAIGAMDHLKTWAEIKLIIAKRAIDGKLTFAISSMEGSETVKINTAFDKNYIRGFLSAIKETDKFIIEFGVQIQDCATILDSSSGDFVVSNGYSYREIGDYHNPFFHLN